MKELKDPLKNVGGNGGSKVTVQPRRKRYRLVKKKKVN
jgi:hypothetical protein